MAEDVTPETEFEDHLEVLREDQLLELIRETVEQLNNLGDKLEAHATRKLASKKEEGSSA